MTQSDPAFDFGFGGCDTCAAGGSNEQLCVSDGADVSGPVECGTCPEPEPEREDDPTLNEDRMAQTP